jgi:aspartyl-tRNA(Asn)/glutamyl-tRNA(Gln) amidotransferase subunit A
VPTSIAKQYTVPTLDLTSLTFVDVARLLARRELSPVELTSACLTRVTSLDSRLGSFINVTPKQALDDAGAAERTNRKGPLHGAPIALKDLYDVRGLPTTAGSSFFRDHIAIEDAHAVSRLRDAGAVFLGKLNLHEIALGVVGDNPHFGLCRNPWDLAHIAGGSSSGSAVAVAAGFCLGSLGSDTGGSIRIPASLCGIVGLKPTAGRVSLRGVTPLSWTLDHAGPMARTVRDVALLLQVVAGHDAADPSSVDVPVDDYLENIERGVAGWHIALLEADAEPEVDTAVENAARLFESLGASIELVRLAELPDAARVNGLITTSDAAAFHAERIERSPEGFGADVLWRMQRGASSTSREHAEARRLRTVITRRFESLFKRHGGDFDLLPTPTT